jgi:hypothetical protein
VGADNPYQQPEEDKMATKPAKPYVEKKTETAKMERMESPKLKAMERKMGMDKPKPVKRK